MILDWYLSFSGASPAAPTDSPTTGTEVASNIVDLGVTNGIPTSANGAGARDIGVGDTPALKLMVVVTTAFASGTSLQIDVAGAPDDGTGAPGSYTVMWTSPAVAEANLDVGAQLGTIDFPRVVPGQTALPRFLRMRYITVGTHTAGALRANIVLDRDDQILGVDSVYSGYRAGITVAN